MGTCCSIRNCFVFFNALFLASGVMLVAIGAIQYSAYTRMSVVAGKDLSKVAVALVAVGCTMAVASILGHIGAFTNNFTMVACFIGIVSIVVILEISIGAVFYMFRSRAALLQVNSAINTKARAAIYEYAPENRDAINTIQEKLSCCGADNHADWSRSVGWEDHSTLPDSCCSGERGSCGQSKTKIHAKGCIAAIKLFLVRNILWAGAVCIALGGTEVLGVLTGVCLCVDIKRKSYERLR